MSEGVRIDRWLWAARFFKTRSLAKGAVEGGKVHVDGDRVKPSRIVRPGSRLRITRGIEHFEVDVVGLAERRGPAPEARKLYRETDESLSRREEAAALRKAARLSTGNEHGRPTKRDRRELDRFLDGQLRRKNPTSFPSDD